MRAELRARIEHRRAAVRACCGSERKQVRAQADEQVRAAREALEALRIEHRRERTWSKPDRRQQAHKPSKRTSAAERDHEVEVNLTPDELTVWRQVKAKIHASPRMSRTEAFSHWLHEHSGEVVRILEQEAERGYREALREKNASAQSSRPRDARRSRCETRSEQSSKLCRSDKGGDREKINAMGARVFGRVRRLSGVAQEVAEPARSAWALMDPHLKVVIAFYSTCVLLVFVCFWLAHSSSS